jgi:hypothetical protein
MKKRVVQKFFKLMLAVNYERDAKPQHLSRTDRCLP